ncbi:MAG: AMIN domain-containing protein [Candidatus Rokubacteria bacterium]|nr:AMIN domain-containing protein [Candidatus Rokubacteria bacterium]
MTVARWILALVVALGSLAPAAGGNPSAESLVQLKDITTEAREDGLTVQLLTTGQPTYKHGLIDTPWRIVIDLEGTAYGWRTAPLTVNTDPLRQIRGSQYRKGVSRVVLELSRKVGYRLAEGPAGLTVKLEPSPVVRSKGELGAIVPAQAMPSEGGSAPLPNLPPERVAPAEPALERTYSGSKQAKAEPEKPATAETPKPVAKAEPVKAEAPKPVELVVAKPVERPVAKAAAPKPVAEAEPAKPEAAKPAEREPAKPVATPVAKAEAPAVAPRPAVEPKAEPKKESTQPQAQQAPEPAPALVRVAQAPSAPAQPPAPPPGQRLISFDFKDAEIVNLLRILAAESGKNIVAGEDVKGKISITLRNVTWELALDTILEARGLQKIEKENVIRIVSSEQLAKESELKAKAEEARVKAAEAKAKAEAEIRAKVAEAQLKEQEVLQRKLAAEAAKAEAEARGPLKEETIRLSYADPEDVVKTLIGILGIPPEGALPAEPTVLPGAPPPIAPSVPTGAPPIMEPPFSQLYGPGAQPPPRPTVSVSAEVLAKGITIRAHKPTNSIFIRHYEADLERIKKLIREKLDVPLPQIKIEARMEILDRSAFEGVGIQLGGALLRTAGRSTIVGKGFQNIRPSVGDKAFEKEDLASTPPFRLFSPNPAFVGLLPINPGTGLPTGFNLVTLPLSQTPAGAIHFGIVGTKFNLNLVLEALKTQGKTTSLARPEIITVENTKASISLGEEIPYATVSSAGTQIQFKEALLKLEVTPTVVREAEFNRIKMKVVVENNARGAATVNLGSGGSPPVINRRKAETEVLIKEGEHLVIGGVTQRTTSELVRKVPILGDIPILGWLFKTRESSIDPDRELVVFITPTVLKTDQSVASTPAQPPSSRPRTP